MRLEVTPQSGGCLEFLLRILIDFLAKETSFFRASWGSLYFIDLYLCMSWNSMFLSLLGALWPRVLFVASFL